MKIKIKKLATIIILSSIISTTGFSQSLFANEEISPFTDLKETHKNFKAIKFLYDNNIIQGYSDNTFKPNKTINRAEFLKLVLKASNIKIENTKISSFKDVNSNSWFAPYVEKAYKENLIQGYQNNEFKPQTEITKAESIKIIGKLQKWEIETPVKQNNFKDVDPKMWFAKYVDYAAKNEYIESSRKYFKPNYNITRGEVSEILYRTMSGIKNKEKEANKEITPEPLNFKPVTQTTIKKDFFKGITLDKELPNTFYENEIYEISGQNDLNTTTTIFINKSNLSKKQTIFREENNSKNFNIPVKFKTPGNYMIGIIDGESGSSKIKEISVIPLVNNNKTIKNITISKTNISFKDDKTKVKFNINSENKETIKKIIFTQSEKSVTYISRQPINEITLEYNDFEGFTNDTITYTVSAAELKQSIPLKINSAFSNSFETKFKPIKHQFTEKSNTINANIPELLKQKTSINFTGTTSEDIKQKAYIIKPDGFVETVTLLTNANIQTYLGSNIIPSKSTFSFNYEPNKNKTYIIEITDKNGLPLINTPVYIGDEIPLLPNYFDLNERFFFDGNIDLKEMRNNMLELINQSRKDYGLDKIVLSEELNKVAQLHSDDMAKNDFFAHVNQSGKTPEDRRKKLNIKTPISENIAKDVTIKFAHLGLMRSATHRANILEQNWDKVGIGISLNKGYLLITEEFASNEVNIEDLTKMRKELVFKINEEREKKGANPIVEKEALNNVAKEVTQLMDNENLTEETFKNSLSKNKINGNSQAIGRVFYAWNEIVNSILEEETDLFNQSWINFGLNVQKNNEANIITSIIINK